MHKALTQENAKVSRKCKILRTFIQGLLQIGLIPSNMCVLKTNNNMNLKSKIEINYNFGEGIVKTDNFALHPGHVAIFSYGVLERINKITMALWIDENGDAIAGNTGLTEIGEFFVDGVIEGLINQYVCSRIVGKKSENLDEDTKDEVKTGADVRDEGKSIGTSSGVKSVGVGDEGKSIVNKDEGKMLGKARYSKFVKEFQAADDGLLASDLSQLGLPVWGRLWCPKDQRRMCYDLDVKITDDVIARYGGWVKLFDSVRSVVDMCGAEGVECPSWFIEKYREQLPARS